MDRNDLTFKELQELLEKVYQKKETGFMTDEDLDELDVHYEEIITEEGYIDNFGMYFFLLKKGVAVIHYKYDENNGKMFIPAENLRKATEEDLERLHKWKQYMQDDLKTIDVIFQEEKLRGLFATLKKSE